VRLDHLLSKDKAGPVSQTKQFVTRSLFV
jgi:hypothetical protein